MERKAMERARFEFSVAEKALENSKLQLFKSMKKQRKQYGEYSKEQANELEEVQTSYIEKVMASQSVTSVEEIEKTAKNFAAWKDSEAVLPDLKNAVRILRDRLDFVRFPDVYAKKVSDLEASTPTDDEIYLKRFEYEIKKTYFTNLVIEKKQFFSDNMNRFVSCVKFIEDIDCCKLFSNDVTLPRTLGMLPRGKSRLHLVNDTLGFIECCIEDILVQLNEFSPTEVLKPENDACDDILSQARRLQQLSDGPGSRGFNEILYCNTPLDQQPITFFREVLDVCLDPSILDKSETSRTFSADAIERARKILDQIQVTDAYSDSQGIKGLRSTIATGIQARDGYVADPDDIYLFDGASSAVDMMMQLLITSKNDGILWPLPRYDLHMYSASITGTLVPYFLDEAAGWGLNVVMLQNSFDAAKSEGIALRALVVVNPGNPTGQVLTQDNQREIVEFCKQNGLVLLAYEVYQEIIYVPDKKFHSFKKISRELGYGREDIQLVSFHSFSEGYMGECEKRGGYMEVTGINNEIIEKIASVNLCSNTYDQILASLVMSPPKVGDESYDLYSAEKDGIISSLARHAKTLEDAFNALEGVSCNRGEGAMFLFPRIELKLSKKAKMVALGKPPDAFYCHYLLLNTGIVVFPGSVFGQAPGTWHIKWTIMLEEDKISAMVENLEKFHKYIMDHGEHHA